MDSEHNAACLAEASEELSAVTATLEQVHAVRRNVGWSMLLLALLGSVPMAITASSLLDAATSTPLIHVIGYGSLLTLIVILGCLLAAWSLLDKVVSTLLRARNDLSAEVSSLRVYAAHDSTQF